MRLNWPTSSSKGEEEHYAVDVAYDGEQGLFLTHLNAYDLVILDILLPKQDGLSVLREMRQERRLTPVLLLTAKDTLEDKVRGLDCGADDYLTKPFAFAELLARVRALLTERRERRATSAPSRKPDPRLDHAPGSAQQ